MRRPRQKGIVPLAIVTVVFWGLLTLTVFLVEPATLKDFPFAGSYAVFFVLVFLAFFFLLTLIFQKSRRGFLFALGVTFFLVMRLLRLGNIVNGLLLAGLVLVIDFYLSNR